MMVAALYVDPAGPYFRLPDVDPWPWSRDAMTYGGPWPVVAHPPCGPWGRLARFSRQDPETGIAAVNAVRRWGGVLEHPAESRLWARCMMPRPGGLPDEHGGLSVAITQAEWGHRAVKPTWLYMVGVLPTSLRPPPFPGAKPTGIVAPLRCGQSDLPLISKAERRLTPPLLAAELVRLAREVITPPDEAGRDRKEA